MNVAWGVVIVVTSTLAWGGQVLAWLAPDLAGRLGLADVASEVDRTFWLDARGEAVWDALVLWTMPVAGLLLMADHEWWPYLALVGGGSYLYFAGRGIAVRVTMRRHSIPIGNAATALVALAIWGTVALVTIGAAITSMESP